MFAKISGALETPFQDAPLDLCEDKFYYARKDLIEARLAEIRDGKASEILQRHDEQFREKETWCVGLSWELCEREDLLDIVEVYSYSPTFNTNKGTNLGIVPRWKVLVNDLQVVLRRL